ncbi:MAG: flavin reductase family protein [Solimonas sp.]
MSHEAAVTRAAFLQAMAHAVTGVQIVTTDGSAGRFAVTTSTMSSVSADPPMLLVCIAKRSPVCQAILEHKAFCLNVLSADQHHISDVFAGRSRTFRPYDLCSAEWSVQSTGGLRLVGAAASFDCSLWAAHEAGSHYVFIGRVLTACDDDRAPLLYTASSYGQPDLFVA